MMMIWKHVIKALEIYFKMTGLITIIQARMGSTRLPGKVLMPLINEFSSLECMVNRVLQSKYISQG